MLPFVADADEFARTHHAMRSCGVGAPIGCLIQLPSAAVGAGDIVEAGAARLLIGLDDLSCLVTGTERGAASDQTLHPAVWEVVDSVVEDAHRCHVLCGLAGSLSKEAIDCSVASGADYVSVHYSQARSLLMPTDVAWPDENLETDIEIATRAAVERLRRDMVALWASHDRSAARASVGRAIHSHQHTTEGEHADGNLHPT
jgi:phosphoenolpyruvate-protein kinase (PTS system EI component)